MDIANSVIGLVKDFGPTVKRYFKYQIYHHNYVSEFEKMQGWLNARVEVVDSNLKTQLEQAGKIPNKEVETWLEEARQEIAEKVIDELICKGGCFTYICSSRKLDKKTQALQEGIFNQGERYTNSGEILVVDNHSIEYRASVFKDKQEQLKYQKEKIQADLETQRRQPGKIAWSKVEDWLRKASQQMAMKVEDLIRQAKCSSSTNIEEKIEELKQILEEGKEFTYVGVSLVIDDHSKKGVTMLAEKCIARDDVQEEILQWLRGDKVTRIAVCGMGGVGKTTIMKQVHNQLLKEPKFNSKVIWVKVSKDFNMVVQQNSQFDILKFQKSIARNLGLDLKNADRDAIELAGLISDTLKQGSFVLILDDVWVPFSVEDVGIPDLVGNNGCKLVLTTRLQHDVARAMSCKEIYVKPLSDKEALELFLDKVEGDLESNLSFRSDIEPFLKQILKKCDGLPLAIGVVAKAMRGKRDRFAWEMADKKLGKSKEIVDCLKFSYDHLEEQYKKCFLYCALYPEDHEIQKEELIEFWIEEGYIRDEGESRHLMICEGLSIIQELIDNCMLESVKEKYTDGVSMHDLLREMALKIIHPQFMVKAGMALEELPEEHEWREDLWKVSLMNNNIRGIPSSMSSPKCPMLTTLLLSNSNIRTISDAFFDHMPGLKILDLSRNYWLHRLPSSVSKLENLTTLLLDDCVLLEEVPSLSNLGGLKKLNLSGTSIEGLPQGLCMLTNLKCLWFDGKLSDIPDGLLRNLSKLQYLGVDWTIPLKWEEIGRLRKMESLVCCFSTLDDMSLFVKSERKFLNQYRIFVGSYYTNDVGSYHTNEVYHYSKTFLNVMKLVVYCRIDICEEPNWLPSDAQAFRIFDCKDVRSLDNISGCHEAIDLRHCIVGKCDDLEFVVSSCCLKLLQNLESLYLHDLKKLNAVFGAEAVAKLAPLPASTFSSLQKIKVEGCGKIKKLLPLRLLTYLRNLQTIKVCRCYEMEEIIWSDYEEEGDKALEKLTLPKLETVKLMGLPALKSIYNGSTTVLICDSLKTIEIQTCREIESVFCTGFNPLPTLHYLELWWLENLKSVFNEEVLGLSPPPTNFSSLRTIQVGHCCKLKKVFSSRWLLGSFQSLEIIEVLSCNQMEELMSSSTYEEKEALEQINLPNLQRLELRLLPELKRICSSSSVLICDSIESLEICKCEKLKRIPLHLSSLDNGQPPSLKHIRVHTKEHWESLEWEQHNAKDVLLPFVNFHNDRNIEEEESLRMG